MWENDSKSPFHIKYTGQYIVDAMIRCKAIRPKLNFFFLPFRSGPSKLKRPHS